MKIVEQKASYSSKQHLNYADIKSGSKLCIIRCCILELESDPVTKSGSKDHNLVEPSQFIVWLERVMGLKQVLLLASNMLMIKYISCIVEFIF